MLLSLYIKKAAENAQQLQKKGEKPVWGLSLIKGLEEYRYQNYPARQTWGSEHHK